MISPDGPRSKSQSPNLSLNSEKMPSLFASKMPQMNSSDDFIDTRISMHSSKSHKSATIEDQLRTKFLSANSVNESPYGKTQSKFTASHIVKMNDIDKTVKMADDLDEYTLSDYTYSSELASTIHSSRQTYLSNRLSTAAYSRDSSQTGRPSRKTNWARRPSVNPALLQLSSSSEKDSSSHEESDSELDLTIEYNTERYSRHMAVSSSSENSDDQRMKKELTRVLRKTLMSSRQTLRNIRDSNETMSSDNSSRRNTIRRETETRKSIAKRFSTAAANSIKDPFSRELTDTTTVDITSMAITNRRRAISSTDQDKDIADCIRQHMEQVATSSKQSERWIINPFSKFRFRWDIATVLVILCNVVTLPLEFSIYDNRPELDRIKLFTDVWFMVDIMLNFRTGIIVGFGRTTVELDPAQIRKRYFRSWFLIDLVATIPFDIFLSILFGDRENKDIEDFAMYVSITRAFKILKLLRLLRLGRFVRYLHRWEEILSMDYGTGENIIKCIKWILIMLMISHWNACILFLVPSASTMGDPPNGTTYTPGESTTHFWIHKAEILSRPVHQQYLWSLFKSMSHMLTIGYGCHTPHVMVELWTSVFVMFTGALTFALFLSQIISIVNQARVTRTGVKRHLREIDDYLKFIRCPLNLKQTIKEYYDYRYRERIFDQNAILNELNPILLEEVSTCGILEYIQGCELFRTCRLDFQKELCKIFQAEMYQPYTDILRSGRSAKTFYIIRQGVVTAEADGHGRGHEYTLEEGDSFGLEAFAEFSSPRYVTTVLSEMWVEVLQVDMATFRELFDKSEYRDIITAVQSNANRQLRTSGLLAQVTVQQKDLRKSYG